MRNRTIERNPVPLHAVNICLSHIILLLSVTSQWLTSELYKLQRYSSHHGCGYGYTVISEASRCCYRYTWAYECWKSIYQSNGLRTMSMTRAIIKSRLL